MKNYKNVEDLRSQMSLDQSSFAASILRKLTNSISKTLANSNNNSVSVSDMKITSGDVARYKINLTHYGHYNNGELEDCHKTLINDLSLRGLFDYIRQS